MRDRETLVGTKNLINTLAVQTLPGTEKDQILWDEADSHTIVLQAYRNEDYSKTTLYKTRDLDAYGKASAFPSAYFDSMLRAGTFLFGSHDDGNTMKCVENSGIKIMDELLKLLNAS